ncbi:hypothetical protein MJH54_34745, partial [Salmonella enterica subsp. enterica serovar Montevideo]|nr:hypothetical protein [Salmonella enterica subsp. enterica serovar Montevideo]
MPNSQQRKASPQQQNKISFSLPIHNKPSIHYKSAINRLQMNAIVDYFKAGNTITDEQLKGMRVADVKK